jgi:hypothetical protein
MEHIFKGEKTLTLLEKIRVLAPPTLQIALR